MMKFSPGPALSAIAALAILAACTTKPQTTAETAPPTTMTQSTTQSTIVPGSLEDFRVNVGDTVHFEFDRSDVTDEGRAILQRQAAWLQKYPQVRITVQGHCDERGTREYNLALGARRANAVREYLASLGVSSGRLDTISYGKERPVCTESDENCWAQNRRGVSVPLGAASS
jgi:peptidoglycan-associated lipoprotein